ncbi:hypothetical protein I4U23_003368 [Adineta vaga]|nr:hypothetical protein I4U23_003368 [Adineta vaga]
MEEVEKQCEKEYYEVSKNLHNAQNIKINDDEINQLKKQTNEIPHYQNDFKKNGEIIILGLQNSGKTTLLRTLQNNPFHEYKSSLCSNDHFCKGFLSSADSILFLVDAMDSVQFPKAKNLLKNEKVSNTPIVIIGSKNDLRV